MLIITHNSWFTFVLVIVTTLNQDVIAAPFGSIPEPSCTPICLKSSVDSSSPSNNKLNYEEGRTYTYQFESTVETKLEQTTDESSKINLKGQAVLSTHSSCDFVLTLENVDIQSPNGQSVSSGVKTLEGSSVRFNYQNGKVEGICTSETDSTWAANIKRSIVSLLQNTATDSFGDTTVMEVDVSGRCPTQYTFSGEKYTKTRNLTNCSYRNGGEWISLGVPYSHAASGINSDPLLKSTLRCEQTISGGIIQISDCLEEHSIEPLDTNVIKTVIRSKVTIDTIEDGLDSTKKAFKDSLKVPSSILFDHTESATSSQVSLKSGSSTSPTETLVQNLCNEIKINGLISSNVPSIYLQLAKAMKSTQLEDLEIIYNRIEQGKYCTEEAQQSKLKKLFIDAASRIGSSDTIEFTINRILEDKVELITQHLFAQHTSFASRPKPSALSAMKRLLNSKNHQDRFIMASTALAYQYCSQSDLDCKYNDEYNALVSVVADLVNDNCQKEDESSVQKAITYLQALGNINQLPEPAVNVLISCFQSSSGNSRVKTNALNAFRRDPCDGQLKKLAFDTFEDSNISSEIRVHAYLASVRCLVQGDIEKLQEILDKEESNQVGSFVSSHIRTQLNNDSPISHDLRRIYRQLIIPKTFPYDPRRFSTNFGYSKFSQADNLGIDVTGNLIYSADHFIPKTAQANLTGYFFGRGYNLFEFGLQLDNFEHLFEKFFGPSSAASTTKSSKTKPTMPQSNAVVKESSDVENSIIKQADIDAKFNEVSPQIKAKFPKPSSGATIDFYIRELGTSIYSNTFTQSELIGLIPTRKSIKSSFLTMYEKFLQEGATDKNFNFDFTEPTTFLDEEIIYSTISGLPLKIQLQGTNVLSLKLDGNLNIPALVRNTESNNNNNNNNNDIRTDIKSTIMPSAATTIKAGISIGTSSFIESGLQYEAKLYSSTGLDLNFVREEGKFELKFNLPEQKTQLLDVRSELFWTEQIENQIEVKSPLASKWDGKSNTIINNQCLNTFSTLFGLKLCTDVKIAGHSNTKAPAFQLAGNSLIGISIEKTEPTMEGFYFKAESVLQSSNDQTISIIFDTPGSKTNRKVTAKGNLHQSLTTIKFGADITTPWKAGRVDYQFWNSDDFRGVELRLGSDASVYSGKVALRKSKDDATNVIEYEPHISYSLPGKTVTVLEGNIKGIPEGIDVNLVAEGQTKAFQGKINGIIQLNHKDYNYREFSLTGIQLENGVLGKIHLDGSLKLETTRTALNLKTLFGEVLDSNCDIDFNYENIPNNEIHANNVRKLEAKISSKHNPNLNVNFQYNRVLSPNNTFENSLTFYHGIDENTRTRLTQETKLFWLSSQNFKVKNTFDFAYPELGIDFSMNADSANSRDKQYLDFNLESGSNVKALIQYEATGDDYDISTSLSYPGQTVKFNEIVNKVDVGQWTFATSFENEREGREPFKLFMDTNFVYMFEKSDINTEILSKLTSTAFKDELTFQSKLVGQPDSYIATLKLIKPDYEIFDFETEYKEALANRPTIFNTKAFVVNYIDGKLRESHDRQSSNLEFEFNWLPSGRKLVATTEFRLQTAEAFNFDGKFQWDAERNPTKFASIQSSTVFQGRSGSNMILDSKNTFIIENIPRELTLKGKLTNSDVFNGETSANIEFKNAVGQLYGIQLKNINDSRNKNKFQNIQIKIYSPHQKGPFELQWRNQASNTDLGNYLGEFVSVLKINYDENQNILLQTELHSIESTETKKWTISGLVEASGSLIADKMRADFNSALQPGHFLYGISSNYRGKASELFIDVDYDTWSIKKTLEYRYKFKSPFYPSIRSIDGSGKYVYLFTSWTNFEVFESGNVNINGNKPSSWEYGSSFLQNDFKAKYNLNSNGNSIINFLLNGKATNKRITGVARNKIANFGTNTELIFEIDRFNKQVSNPSINLKLNLTPQNKSLGVLGYRFNLKSLNNGEVYETSFRGRSLANSNNRLAAATKIEFSNLRKSFDVVLSTDSTSTRKIFFLLSGPIDNKYNVETIIRWGEEGKTITSSGTLLKSGSTIDGTLMLDSPHFNANKWKVRVATDLAVTGRHALTFVAHSADKEVGNILIDYSRKEIQSNQTTHYNGSLAVKISTLDFSGAFNTIDKMYQVEKDAGEEGRQIKTILELNNNKFPVNFEAVYKRTNLEDQASLSFCNENYANCQIAQIRNEKFNSKIKSGQILSLTSTTITTSTDGLKRSTSEDSFIMKILNEGQNFEHSTSLRSTWPQIQELGYKLFSIRNGKKQGFEIIFPQRKMVAEINKEFSPEQSQILFEGWLDKIRKPDQKLAIIFNSALFGPSFRQFDNSMESELEYNGGRQISLIVQHPSLEKDLIMKARSVLKTERKNISSATTELVLDVFKLTNQALILTFKSVRDFSEDSIGYYGLDFGMKSVGTNLRLDLHSDIRTSGNEISTESKLVYLNRQSQERSYNFAMDYSHNKRALYITGPAGRILSYLSSYNFQQIPGTNTFDSFEVRREIFLPGMADTRIFQNKVTFDETPNVDIKMYTASSPAGQYQELKFGFKSDKEFIVSLAEFEKQGHRNLVEFNLALNNSRLLFVKTEWDKDNIKHFLAKCQTRLQDTSTRFKSMITDSSIYLTSEVQHLTSKIKDALPNLQPLIHSTKDEFLQLKSEVELLDHLENFGHYMDFIFNIFGTDSKAVKQLFSSYSTFTSKIISNFVDYLTISLPETISTNFDTITPAVINSIQKCLHALLDASVETSNVISTKIIEAFEKLSQLSHSNNLFTDLTNGIGKFWNETIFQGIDSMSKAWMSFTASSLFDNEYVKGLMTEYEKVFGNVIDNYKQQVDGFRQSLLDTLSSASKGDSSKEVQEFLQKVMEYVEFRSKGRSVGFDDGKDNEEMIEIQLRNEIYEKFVIAMTKITSKVFTVDLKNGLILAQVPLPTPIRSLTDIDKLFDSLPSYKIRLPSMPTAAQDYFNYNNFNLQELINSKFNNLKELDVKESLKELLPPFNAYGLLIGSQFYRTFDGRFYLFNGNCQYLLASDFVDKNFTVFVNYKKDLNVLGMQKSIVITDHKHTISIEPDQSVLIDGIKGEIPYNISGFQIYRNQNWVRVQSDQGIDIGCSTQKDVCIVQLNGYYQGKTSGLLGTLNNEYFDDLRTSNGDITYSSKEMAISWKLNDQCEEDPTRSNTNPSPVRNVDLIQKCHSAFQSRLSPLSFCFDKVTTSNYEHICTSMRLEPDQDSNQSVCTAAIGYKAACKSANINIDTRSLC